MSAKSLRCRKCGTEFPLENLYSCSSCGGLLEVVYDYEHMTTESLYKVSPWGTGQMWQYYDLLPINDEHNIVSLGEGGTPLLKADRLSSEMECNIFLKLECITPSGSFKDRPTSVAVSKAKELRANTVIVASSGNAAASTAAYAARAGINCIVCIPTNTEAGKVSQAISHGAKVVYVEGSFSNSFKIAKMAAELYGWPNITTTFINPYTIEGDKTISYELWKQMGQVPDYIFIPVGDGPLLVGVYKGFLELKRFSLIDKLPRMIGVQSAQCSPIAQAYINKSNVIGWVYPINTMATGIADPLIGYEEDGDLTLSVIINSGGCMVSLDEEEIYNAYTKLAVKEGIFAEPTGAVPIGAVQKLLKQGYIKSDDKIVCLITGHGLKRASSLKYKPPTITTLEELREVVKIMPKMFN